jgi:hypothetical protein
MITNLAANSKTILAMGIIISKIRIFAVPMMMIIALPNIIAMEIHLLSMD